MKKAFTLSYDDGVLQDKRFVSLLNKYGLKCTFNLNSGLMNSGIKKLYKENVFVSRMDSEGLKELYAGHEIAVHGAKHIRLSNASKEETNREILEDKKALSKMFACDIEGAAYAYGQANEYTKEVFQNSGIKYSRSTKTTGNFNPSADMFFYESTCHHSDEKLFELAKEFIELKPVKPQIFYVWGHTYEFDEDESQWERIEEFFKLISGHNDILYGTNIEVFKYFNLV